MKPKHSTNTAFTRRHILTQLFGLSVLPLLSPRQLTAAPSPWIGKAFPDVGNLTPVSGEPLSKNPEVILYDFWASWCPPCKASFPVMDRLVKDYGPQGLQVIAINEDEEAKHMHRFLKRRSVAFAIFRDEGNQLIQRLQVKTMPSAFVVDRHGQVQSVHEGFHGKRSEAAYRKTIEHLLKANP